MLLAFGRMEERKNGRKERRRNKEDTQWRLTKWYWGPMRGKHNLSMRYLCATYARAMRGSYDAVGSSWSAGVSSILKAGPRHPKLWFWCASLSLRFITTWKNENIHKTKGIESKSTPKTIPAGHLKGDQIRPKSWKHISKITFLEKRLLINIWIIIP